MASVTTIASVVFSAAFAAAAPFRRIDLISAVNDDGSPRPPYSSPISNGAAQNHGPSPIVVDRPAFPTASAPPGSPVPVVADAEPSPPFKLATLAPSPPPTLPSAKS